MSADPAPSETERLVLAGGCFWCTEAVFSELRGVVSAVPGYAGGSVANPTYEQVCAGRTGHAEAVDVTFDPRAVSVHDLLVIFFTTHDPTTMNRQGPDTGTQYRSAVFYRSPAQKAAAEEAIREVTEEKLYSRAVVTEVTALTTFYPAEEYHRGYYRRHPEQAYCQAVIAPKLAKFRSKYASRLGGAAWSATPGA